MIKYDIAQNSLIKLDDLTYDEKGKGHKFTSKFLEPGIAHYAELGDILITKQTIDKFIHTMIGCPVIINHKDITDKNVNDERVGVISDVWYNDGDGYYYCSGVIWDKQAIDLIKNEGWNVSCAYSFKSDKKPVMHNGKKVDMEFTDGDFQHLAIVKVPRYENANIVVNSADMEEDMTEFDIIENGGVGSGDFDHAGRPPEVGESEPAGTGRKGKYEGGKQQLTGAKPKEKTEKSEDKSEKSAPEGKEGENGKQEGEVYKLKTKTTTVKTKHGERKIEYVEEPPKGWKEDKDATTAPRGYKWYNNNKGLFDKDSKMILVKDKHYWQEENKDKALKGKRNNLFNSKDSKDRKEKLTMAVMNELKKMIENVVNNALGRDDKRAGIDKVAGIMKEAGCDDVDIRTAIGVMEKIAYDKTEAGTADNKCDKVKNACVKNEDKRKIIDEIGGVLKGKVDDEVIRTVIGKAEKIAYNPSEDDKADNCGKAKNEDDKKEEIKEKFDEEKEIGDVKNSMDDLRQAVYGGSSKTAEPLYISQSDRFELGNEY